MSQQLIRIESQEGKALESALISEVLGGLRMIRCGSKIVKEIA